MLAVSYAPDPRPATADRPAETDAQYADRVQLERVLTLHEGFNPDP